MQNTSQATRNTPGRLREVLEKAGSRYVSGNTRQYDAREKTAERHSANMHSANMHSANMHSANMRGASMHNASVDGQKSCESYPART